MRFVDSPSELKDPLYLQFKKTKNIDEFPKKLSLTDYTKLQTETVEELLKEIFSLIESHDIKSLHRKIIVEPCVNPSHAIYADYKENEDGNYIGIGEPISFTKTQIGIFVQLMGSKFESD